MKNSVLDVILSRSSIRAYADTPLTEEALSALKEAALASPTARNLQAQRYIFITNKAILAEIERIYVDHVVSSGDQEATDRLIARNYKVLYNAPLFVVVAIDPSNAYGKVDAGIAVENLALAAKSLGLDSVILGLPAFCFNGERGADLRGKVSFPEGMVYGIGIAIGYPAMDKEPHETDSSHIICIK